jgi:hypothetical protein
MNASAPDKIQSIAKSANLRAAWVGRQRNAGRRATVYCHHPSRPHRPCYHLNTNAGKVHRILSQPREGSALQPASQTPPRRSDCTPWQQEWWRRRPHFCFSRSRRRDGYPKVRHSENILTRHLRSMCFPLLPACLRREEEQDTRPKPAMPSLNGIVEPARPASPTRKQPPSVRHESVGPVRSEGFRRRRPPPQASAKWKPPCISFVPFCVYRLGA